MTKCQARTQTGGRCSRQADEYGRYCYQHQVGGVAGFKSGGRSAIGENLPNTRTHPQYDVPNVNDRIYGGWVGANRRYYKVCIDYVAPQSSVRTFVGYFRAEDAQEHFSNEKFFPARGVPQHILQHLFRPDRKGHMGLHQARNTAVVFRRDNPDRRFPNLGGACPIREELVRPKLQPVPRLPEKRLQPAPRTDLIVPRPSSAFPVAKREAVPILPIRATGQEIIRAREILPEPEPEPEPTPIPEKRLRPVQPRPAVVVPSPPSVPLVTKKEATPILPVRATGREIVRPQEVIPDQGCLLAVSKLRQQHRLILVIIRESSAKFNWQTICDQIVKPLKEIKQLLNSHIFFRHMNATNPVWQAHYRRLNFHLNVIDYCRRFESPLNLKQDELIDIFTRIEPDFKNYFTCQTNTCFFNYLTTIQRECDQPGSTTVPITVPITVPTPPITVPKAADVDLSGLCPIHETPLSANDKYCAQYRSEGDCVYGLDRVGQKKTDRCRWCKNTAARLSPTAPYTVGYCCDRNLLNRSGGC